MLTAVRRAVGRVRRAVVRRIRPPAPVPPGPSSWTGSPWVDGQYPFRRIAAMRPDVVLDVGANEGQFVDSLRAAGYGGRVISFEPQRSVFEALQRKTLLQPPWECHNLALGDAEAKLPIHVSAFSQSSSLLGIGRLHTDLMPQTAEVGLEEVPVVRLDAWAGAASLEGRRLFLKLDVQGYELPVIRGAGELLRFVEGALVELDFASLFDGQSRYYEVMAALESAGLRFVGLCGGIVHPSTSDLLWGDGFFLRHRADSGARQPG